MIFLKKIIYSLFKKGRKKMKSVNSRKNKLKLNILFSFLYQIVGIICGFILPRLILSVYGSKTNGLVNSIESILQVITLMEMGVGAVVQSSLYKPLADNNNEMISRIMYSAKKYFRLIGIIFLVFVGIVLLIYPSYISDEFDVSVTIYLIIAISISLFSQYYFGIVNSLLIQADQKSFIYYIIQIIAVISNTIICSLLMVKGYSINVIKFASATVFLIRPILLNYYVKKNYNLLPVKNKGNELPQKWNGVAQHIASYILMNTDILVLTVFSSIENVSIYSTYYLVAYSLRVIITAFTAGFQSYYGNQYASNEIVNLKQDFEKYTFFTLFLSTLFFSIAIIMIVPFVLCYTSGVTDANYNQFIFGVLLLLGQYMFCYRRAFNVLVLSLGKFKETQVSSIIEALLNVIISVILVFRYNLIGVAIGTFIAMFYRTISFAIYFSKNILERPIFKLFKDLITNYLIIFISIFIGFYLNTHIVINNFIQWSMYSFLSSITILIIIFIVYFLFDREKLKYIKELKLKYKK